jgi:hypothetical protein
MHKCGPRRKHSQTYVPSPGRARPPGLSGDRAVGRCHDHCRRSEQEPFFVISEVLSGKRQATLRLADKANLQAKADRIAQQVANAQVRVEVTGEGLITLKGDERRCRTADRPQAGDGPAGRTCRPIRRQVRLKWDPLDCATRQGCDSLFGPFADLMKQSKPSLSPEDLAR